MMAPGVLILHWHPLPSLRPGAIQTLPDVSRVWASCLSNHEAKENMKVLLLQGSADIVRSHAGHLLMKANGTICVQQILQLLNLSQDIGWLHVAG